MSLKRQLLLLLVLVLSITLAGFSGVAQGQGATKNPDTLTLAYFGDADSLDPAWAYDDFSQTITTYHVYEPLLIFNGGATGLFLPLLATEVPSLANGGISADARTYTFKIREGVKFHDGTPLTAEDVKYSILRFMFMDRDGGPSWILLAPILGEGTTRDEKGNLRNEQLPVANRAIQVQGNTLKITLKEPYAPFMGIVAQWTLTVSKKWAIAHGDWDGTVAGLVKLNNPPKAENTSMFTSGNGTGPFKLVQWDRQNRVIILERNDNYWRAPAKLKRIIIRSVDDFAARRLMLQQGDADVIDVDRPNQPQVEGLAGVRVIDELPLLANIGIFMSLSVDVGGGNPDVGSGKLDGNGIPGNFFTDVNVRRGVAQAFDYAAAIRDCYRGKAAVGHGPIPKGMSGYNPAQKWYAFDRDKAAAAFREAFGGQLWNLGFKFTVLFNTGNTTRQCLAQVMKDGIEALNPKFKVDVRSLAWPGYLAAYRQKKLPMFIIGWGADYPDEENFVTAYQHSKEGTYSVAQSYNNPEADKLVVQSRTEADPAKRKAIFYRLQEIAFNDISTLYLDRFALLVMRTWVRGWYYNPAFLSHNAVYFYTWSK
jgi:peptide/nickel transport system substrate-binding protein